MEKFKYLKTKEINKLPKTPGVYTFKKGGKILYIGKAANIRERVKNHFGQPGYRDNSFLDKVERIGYIKTNSEFAEPSAHLTSHPASQGSTIEAMILEANLIKKYQPKYNIVWRDDKNYFFVAVTEEDFPRVFITHQPKLQTTNYKLQTKYVGPFVDGKALKQTLKVLRKVFPYRTCRVIPNRPCLWYHLNRCPAPCLLKSKFIQEIPPDSLKIKKFSQRNTKNLMKILKEGKNPVLNELKREMKLAVKKQDFEEAAKIRDQIGVLEKILAHAKIFGEASTAPQSNFWPYKRIEAYDISNIQGQEATGSMVTFINGLPDKNFYRRFKIKISGKPNDIAMIKECLTRRLNHPEWGMPDLILIDGGIAQLNTVVKIKIQHPVLIKSTQGVSYPKVMALAKKKNELFIEGQKKPILLRKLPREIFNLILQLRDEAHRFARSYHHKLREKGLLGD